ncbi:MAG: B-box zinc finger protein, partial [Candidatus Geothermincolia bacterium]
MECERHPGQEAIGKCLECGKGICPQCIAETNDVLSCPACHQAEVARIAASMGTAVGKAPRAARPAREPKAHKAKVPKRKKGEPELLDAVTEAPAPPGVAAPPGVPAPPPIVSAPPAGPMEYPDVPPLMDESQLEGPPIVGAPQQAPGVPPTVAAPPTGPPPPAGLEVREAAAAPAHLQSIEVPPGPVVAAPTADFEELMAEGLEPAPGAIEEAKHPQVLNAPVPDQVIAPMPPPVAAPTQVPPQVQQPPAAPPQMAPPQAPPPQAVAPPAYPAGPPVMEQPPAYAPPGVPMPTQQFAPQALDEFGRPIQVVEPAGRGKKEKAPKAPREKKERPPKAAK